MTNEKSLSEVAFHGHKYCRVYQWCANSNQDDLRVVSVILIKVHVRKYCENIFPGSNIANRFQVHFQAQSQVTLKEKETVREQFLGI